MSNPQSWNRYSYVTNRPIILSDPTGHDPIITFLILIAATFILTACDSSSAYEGLTPRQTEIQKLIDKEDYQGAIDQAVELYDIDTHDVKPNYGELEDGTTGLTYPYGGEWDENDNYVGGYVGLIIGKDAFKSPDILVDTLAHEYVHVERFQKGLWSRTDDGKALREVEAYDRIASRQDELELSDKATVSDRDNRNWYYDSLPTSLKKRIDAGIYDLP